MHEVLLEYSHVEFSERGVVVKLHLHLPSTIVDPFGTSKTWSSSSLTAGWGGGHSTQKSIFKSCVGSNFSEGKKHPKTFQNEVSVKPAKVQVRNGSDMFQKWKAGVSFIILLREPFNTSNLHSFAHTSNKTGNPSTSTTTTTSTNHNTNNSNSKGKSCCSNSNSTSSRM